MTDPIHTANNRDRVGARLMHGSAPGRARVAGKRFTRDYQPKGRGRPKGSTNEVTRNVKEAILAACEAFGEDGKGKRGLEGYFIRMARDRPAAVGKMLLALLPKHPMVERNQAPPEYKSLAEVRKELAKSASTSIPRSSCSTTRGRWSSRKKTMLQITQIATRNPAEYVAAAKEGAAAQAREQFFAFRKLMRPHMIWGWWVELLCMELQQFYEDFRNGKRPKLAIMAPPQHGKSWAVIDFIAWVAGKNPDLKTIFASYSRLLGEHTNLQLKRMLMSENYQLAFEHTQIGGGWTCNTEHIQYAGYAGSFRKTTIEGAITGRKMHLGVIDDPVKGYAEAHSQLVRDRTWNWFATDFLSRLAQDGAVLIIMTRWHVDDLLGRLIERVGDVKMLRFPAICERSDNYRRQGEALFPELKSLDFLQERRRMLDEDTWQAQEPAASDCRWRQHLGIIPEWSLPQSGEQRGYLGPGLAGLRLTKRGVWPSPLG